MTNTVHRIYGNKVRARVCGICIHEQKLLLVNHRGLAQGDFWAPPGGGIEFSESAPACLIREFQEETGLVVSVGKFLFACEFINPPLHAVELFFEVAYQGGQLKSGHDPEMESSSQILSEARFFSWKEIADMDPAARHSIFRSTSKPQEITGLRGYFKL